jgi:enamine deaminase RidA (YjgF/YER057c/UK114 family)
MSKIQARLTEMGIKLPAPPSPKANPKLPPGVISGNLLFCQGTLGHHENNFPYLGKVGGPVTTEQGYASARLCAINHLAQAQALIGNLDRISRVVQLHIFVNGVPGFEGAPYVANGASDLFLEVFGPVVGACARASLSVPDLIYTAPVETTCIFELRPAP